VLTRIDHAVPTAIKVAIAVLGLLALGLAMTALLGRRRLASERLRADTDVLTGLSNHRCIQETLHRMFAYARRTGNPLAAVVLDLDYFKAINDTYGHAKGDEVLTRVGDAIRQTLRASDFAGRYGGEEFVVLLPDTDEAGAMTTAEKVRETLKGTTIPGLDYTITGSFGIAASNGGYDTPNQMLAAADHALYRAKAGGRDTIETADPVWPARPVAACVA
jgi:diguanylate cyclase (GGDEF)-like protein